MDVHYGVELLFRMYTWLYRLDGGWKTANESVSTESPFELRTPISLTFFSLIWDSSEVEV